MSTIQTLQTSVDALLVEIEQASSEPGAQHRMLEFAAKGLRRLIEAIRRSSTSLYRFVTDSGSFPKTTIGKKLLDLSTELTELHE